MDLGTVKSNLKVEKYRTVGDCLEDIQLIWTNCKTYNMQGSEIWKLAVQLEKHTNKLIEKSFKNTTTTVNSKKVKKEDESVVDQTEENPSEDNPKNT